MDQYPLESKRTTLFSRCFEWNILLKRGTHQRLSSFVTSPLPPSKGGLSHALWAPLSKGNCTLRIVAEIGFYVCASNWFSGLVCSSGFLTLKVILPRAQFIRTLDPSGILPRRISSDNGSSIFCSIARLIGRAP